MHCIRPYNVLNSVWEGECGKGWMFLCWMRAGVFRYPRTNGQRWSTSNETSLFLPRPRDAYCSYLPNLMSFSFYYINGNKNERFISMHKRGTNNQRPQKKPTLLLHPSTFNALFQHDSLHGVQPCFYLRAALARMSVESDSIPSVC